MGSASKHTPGPWSRELRLNGTYLLLRQVDVVDEDDAGDEVSTVEEERFLLLDHDSHSDETVEADTRLIAAAPSMLEELRKAEQLALVAGDWNLDEVEIDGEMVPIYEVVSGFRAAIAQARGEEVSDG